MKNQNTKPPVMPPESHAEPLFPTLAALGILAAATTLTAGCERNTHLTGDIQIIEEDFDFELDGTPASVAPVMSGQSVSPEEKETKVLMRGEMVAPAPPEEKAPRIPPPPGGIRAPKP